MPEIEYKKELSLIESSTNILELHDVLSSKWLVCMNYRNRKN